MLIYQKHTRVCCICIYLSGKEKKKDQEDLRSPMYSGRHIFIEVYIYLVFTQCNHWRAAQHTSSNGRARAWKCTAPPAPPQEALGHSRKSTSQSETKGVRYLWRSEAASQAFRPLSSLCTEEEQFMELFIKVN